MKLGCEPKALCITVMCFQISFSGKDISTSCPAAAALKDETKVCHMLALTDLNEHDEKFTI